MTVSSAAFSPTAHLATSSFDKTLRVWDVATGKEMKELKGTSSPSARWFSRPTAKCCSAAGFDETALWMWRQARSRQSCAGTLAW
jgi:WD40 repeat protein